MAMAGQGIVNSNQAQNSKAPQYNQGNMAPGKADYNKRGSDLKKAGQQIFNK